MFQSGISTYSHSTSLFFSPIRFTARFIAGAILALVLLTGASAQDQPRFHLPYQSPNAVVEQSIGVTLVKVQYSRPSLKGRTLGKFVATRGQVWRTGANQNTTISVSTDVQLGDNKLEIGTYSLFTIPGEKSWTIIINKNANQWGAFTYKASDDVFRFDVPAGEGDYRDQFMIYFEKVTDYGAEMVIHWGSEKVSVPITVDSNREVRTLVTTALKTPFHWLVPNEFATFSNRNNVFLEDGLAWAEQSVGMGKGPANLERLAELRYKLGKFAEALPPIEQAISMMKYPGNMAIKARILAKLGRFNEAISTGREALDMPQNPIAYGWIVGLGDEIERWENQR